MNLATAYIYSLIALLISCVASQSIMKPAHHGSTLLQRLMSLLFVFCFLVAVDSILLLVTKRPFFSSGIAITMLVIVAVVNHAKYATLREPLVFSDFYLYIQAFKHPRLYFPFVGVWPIIGIVFFVPLIFITGLMLENVYFTWFSVTSLYLVFLSATLLFSVFCCARTITISGGVIDDTRKYGVVLTLLLYFSQSFAKRNELQERLLNESPFYPYNDNGVEATRLNDLVVVQSESFFDARSLGANIKGEILSQYDVVCSQACMHGNLKVPAWGANTMRTEFAFLTGLNPDVLGLAQYYPYQQLLRYKVPSLVSHLKSVGYYCICIHPHAAGFFMRDEFFKQLGFDEFIDDKAFANAKRAGPYIADSEVTQKIKQITEGSEKPLFIFAITMENHGPLHLESVSDGEWKQYFTESPGSALDDLLVYLRHLKNADQMIDDLRTCFLSRKRQTTFGFYGDHVPAISKIYELHDYNDSRSNFFIWSTDDALKASCGEHMTTELTVENLADVLVERSIRYN